MDSWATHNRAGEISYRRISGWTYEITITTYTDPLSAAADRCELENFSFGDGQLANVPRVNCILPPTGTCACMGQITSNPSIKKNIYKINHTYSGPGIYQLGMDDPNRNANILNIPVSVETSFFLPATLVISSLYGANTSPSLLFPPVDAGCVKKPFYHNPGAVDPDGDSLVYYIDSCRGTGGAVIPGYVFPNLISPGSNNSLSINPTTGTLYWDAPQTVGDYNIAIKIEEYRKDIFGVMQFIGSITRDMQITIGNCDNNPPIIEPMPARCVLAGATVTQQVKAYDPDDDLVTLEGVGEPLELLVSPATFTDITIATDTALSFFNWVTSCDHIRIDSYTTTFKAEDRDKNFPPTNLVVFADFDVRVIAPAPTNVIATPLGSSMILQWDYNICSNHSGFSIYRYSDSTGYVPASCETGVPSSTGYQLIGEVDKSTTNYTDNGGVDGLINGVQYCYMIVANYENGAESQASAEVCAQLKKDIPVIIRASVNSTDTQNGSDTIQWVKPTELSTDVFPGPYYYKIYAAEDGQSPNQSIFQTATDLLDNLDTIYVNSGINTKDVNHVYRVELYSKDLSGQDVLVGTTRKAETIYLNLLPEDNRVTLSWVENAPWQNYKYEIYRKNNTTGQFEFLDTTITQSYVDGNLTNGVEYCYYVRSFGKYSADGFPSPLINNSQINCAEPVDVNPPCPPIEVRIDSDCENGWNKINWTSPNSTCPDNPDDAISYRLYYTPQVGTPVALIGEFPDINTTEAFYENLISVAGCYALTTLDSAGNESDFSEAVCVDNCPIYELPQVFSPGNDGVNDFFVPFPYRHIESIDLHIYDRWGVEVFHTIDPAINWNGNDIANGNMCTDGVYFYTCTVNEIRLSKSPPRYLKGTISLLRGPNQPTQ